MTPRRLIEPARLASTAVLRGQSDARLIDLTRAGNERAFEAIVQRYRKPLLRHCARILPPGRAEDAVQQTFLSAYKAISTGDDELRLRPWLYKVARNNALNLLRQNGWNHDQLDDQFDGVMRPDQAVEGRERIRALVASVKRLPERQRDAIVLRELEGRSYEEIAVALGVTDGAVRQLLNRARTTLRAGATALTPYGLAERLAAAAWSGPGPAVSERIAEICSGAGGALSLAKVGAAVLVAGAVAGGAGNQGIPGLGGSGGHGTPSADAASAPAGPTVARDVSDPRSGPGKTASTHRSGRRGDDGARHERHHSHRGRSRHGSGERSHSDGATGGMDTRMVDDHRGPGGGDHSGSGTSGGSSEDMSSGTSGGDSGSGGPGPSSPTSGTSGDGGGSGSSGSSGPDGGSITQTTTSGGSSDDGTKDGGTH